MRRLPLTLGLLVALVLSVALLWWLARPTWTVDRVRDVVIATLQEEQAASDLVTGRVGVTARREIRDRGRFSWVPEWASLPGVNLVSAEVRVEIPGQALYGFDVRELRPEMIDLGDDGVVEVRLPPLRVVAIEPNLEQLEIHSREGVLRRGAARPLEREALRDVQDALRAQGERHLATSTQPALNTARALAETLRPALVAAGMRDPRFRFRIGDELVLEPRPTGVPADAPPRLALPTDR